MSVNIKENGNLTTVANNISITQANWNDRGNTNKNTCIKNQPATLKTLEEVSANTDENALVGANAVKELSDSLGSQKILTQFYINTIEASTPTAFDCNWNRYNLLMFAYCYYDNIYKTVIAPSYYFNQTHSTTRIVMFDIDTNDASIEIYKKDDSSVYVRASESMVAKNMNRLKIFGLFPK